HVKSHNSTRTCLTPQGLSRFDRARIRSTTINAGGNVNSFDVVSTRGDLKINGGSGISHFFVGAEVDGDPLELGVENFPTGDLSRLGGPLPLNGTPGFGSLIITDSAGTLQNPTYTISGTQFRRAVGQIVSAKIDYNGGFEVSSVVTGGVAATVRIKGTPGFLNGVATAAGS